MLRVSTGLCSPTLFLPCLSGFLSLLSRLSSRPPFPLSLSLARALCQSESRHCSRALVESDGFHKRAHVSSSSYDTHVSSSSYDRWLSQASTCPTCRHSLPSQHHEVVADASSTPASLPEGPLQRHPEGVASQQQAAESGDSPDIADAAGAANAQGRNRAAHMGARAGERDAVAVGQRGAGEGISPLGINSGSLLAMC
jgi:hypothetical protein